MTETLVGQQSTDRQELAKLVRTHPFVNGPTRKLAAPGSNTTPHPHRSPGPR